MLWVDFSLYLTLQLEMTCKATVVKLHRGTVNASVALGCPLEASAITSHRTVRHLSG